MRKLLLFFVFFLVPCFACTQGALGNECDIDTSGVCKKSAGKCLEVHNNTFEVCDQGCKGSEFRGADGIVFNGETYPSGGLFYCDGNKWTGRKFKHNFNLSQGMRIMKYGDMNEQYYVIEDGNEVFVSKSLGVYSRMFGVDYDDLRFDKIYTTKDLFCVAVKKSGHSFYEADIPTISSATGYDTYQVFNEIMLSGGARLHGYADGIILEEKPVSLPICDSVNKNNNQKTKNNSKKNGCTPEVLAGLNAAKGKETKDGGCVAKECNPGYYFVYKNGIYQGWCVGNGYCKNGKKLNIIDGDKTDLKCIDTSKKDVKDTKPSEKVAEKPKENVSAKNENIDAVSKDELNNLIDNLKKELDNGNLQDKQKVEDLIKQLDNIRKSLDGKVDNRQVQEAIQTALDGFAASVHNSSDSRLGEMYNDVVRQINDYVVPVENRLTDLEGVVGGLYGVTTDQGVAISGLGTRIDGVKADVDGLYGKNAELVNSLYSLQGLTDAQKKQIANLSEMLKGQDKKVADVVQLVLGTAETLSDAQKKEVLRLIEEYVAGQNYMQRDEVENLIKQFMKEHMDSVNKIREQEVVRDKINSAMSVLNSFAASAKVSVWKDKEGNFNTARLASDSVAGVVLGTAGGLISNHLIKKSQVKNGMEDIRCTVGGLVVAEYGDEFMVGMQ